jgi:hypothetical protein
VDTSQLRDERRNRTANAPQHALNFLVPEVVCPTPISVVVDRVKPRVHLPLLLCVLLDRQKAMGES